jgi:HAD superfamily hydrolase (TIGR01509 family)
MSAVIFDMDGVLVNSEPLHFSVEKVIFRELGVDVSAEEHHALVGMSPLEIWQVLKQRHDLPDEAVMLKNREADRKVERFSEMEIPLVPGVVDLLQELKDSDISLALASSSPRRLIELFIRKTGTASYFGKVLSGEEVEQGKPAPDIFLRAADMLGVAPPDCTVIEDSHNGMRAALAAGMRCVGFQNPHSGKQDLGRSHLRIDSFSAGNRARILKLAMNAV